MMGKADACIDSAGLMTSATGRDEGHYNDDGTFRYLRWQGGHSLGMNRKKIAFGCWQLL